MDLDCKEEFINDKSETEFDPSIYCLTNHPRPIEDAEEHAFSELISKTSKKKIWR